MTLSVLSDIKLSALPTKYYLGDQIKNNAGETCSTHVGEESAYRVLEGKREGKNHLEDPGVDGWSKLIWTLSGDRGMGWIDLAQDRDRWRALLNAVMNCRLPKNARNF